MTPKIIEIVVDAGSYRKSALSHMPVPSKKSSGPDRLPRPLISMPVPVALLRMNSQK